MSTATLTRRPGAEEPNVSGTLTGASLLVIGSASDHPASADELGDTARALLGRIGCPVAVIPHRTRNATRPAW